MKELLAKRINEMSQEIQALHNEREAMINRDREIEVRLHQLVGAVYEMQQLITHLDRQPSLIDQVEIVTGLGPAESSLTDQRSTQISSEIDDQNKAK